MCRVSTASERCAINVLTLIVVFTAFLILWIFVFYRSTPLSQSSSNDNVLRSWEQWRSPTANEPRDRSIRQSRLRSILVPKSVVQFRNNSSVVDCASSVRYCATSSDCSFMCTTAENVSFGCDAKSHTCQPFVIDVRKSPPNDRDDKHGNGDHGNDGGEFTTTAVCDTKSGEYAMLVGYSSIGTAIWQCVQLYKQFKGSLCEGGVFDPDARLREPSYRDCNYPDGTERVIKKISTPYDIQLPHCVSSDTKQFYMEDMMLS